jgi:hypothetical protein
MGVGRDYMPFRLGLDCYLQCHMGIFKRMILLNPVSTLREDGGMGKKEAEYSEGAQKVKDFYKKQREEVKAKQRKGRFFGLIWLLYYFVFICGAVSIFGASYITGIVIFLGYAIHISIVNNSDEP